MYGCRSPRCWDRSASTWSIGEVTGHRLRPARGHRSPDARRWAYDRLVFALGSELVRPPIPGLTEHGFDIDTYDAAAKNSRRTWPRFPTRPRLARSVHRAGGRRRADRGREWRPSWRHGCATIAGGEPARVILADRAPRIGSNMGDGACAVIDEALRALGVETRPGVTVASVDAARGAPVVGRGDRRRDGRVVRRHAGASARRGAARASTTGSAASRSTAF